MIGMFLFGIFMAVMDYISTRQYGDYEAQITNVLFIYALTVAILIPAFALSLRLSAFLWEQNTVMAPYATK